MFSEYKLSQKFAIFFIILNSLFGDSVAVIKSLKGVSMIKRLESTGFNETAFIESKINNGDALRINKRAHISLVYLDETIILTLLEDTRLELVDTENTRTINVAFGTILQNVKSHPESRIFRIETPFSVATTRFGEFAAIVDPENGTDHFICQYGTVEVINLFSGRLIKIGPDQKVVSNGIGEIISAPSFSREYPVNPGDKVVDFSIKKDVEEAFEDPVVFPDLDKKQPDIIEKKEIVESSMSDPKTVEIIPDTSSKNLEKEIDKTKEEPSDDSKSLLSSIFSLNGILKTIFRVIFIYTFILGSSS